MIFHLEGRRRGTTAFEAFVLFLVVVQLVVYAALIFVAIHFLLKVW